MGFSATAYGGKKEIPTNPDLLIAGFSCVDFSNLNTHKQQLEDKGESGDTFRSILLYAHNFRPKAMILENVSSAPWERIRAYAENDRTWGKGAAEKQKLKEAMDNIWGSETEPAYSCRWAKFDSKDFYIPQTRQRGYAICIDRRLFSIPEANFIADQWLRNMTENFQRPASSPVDAFLLPPTDRRMRRARQEAGKPNDPSRARPEVDWGRCQIRYVGYRLANSLGHERPLTKWVDGGGSTPPGYFWKVWHRYQVERVWDSIDISYLRNANLGAPANFDSRYKTRIWELSQNVDRAQDKMSMGLAGCVTPSGIPFVSTRGGPVIGPELLTLQGLPFEKLNLGHLSDRAIHNLAGNAMTSTVVGAGILSYFLACTSLLPKPSRRVPRRQEQLVIDMDSSQLGDIKSLQPKYSTSMPISELLQSATFTKRLCSCEILEGNTRFPLFSCLDCGLTLCKDCRTLSAHSYSSLEAERRPPLQFVREVTNALPMRVHIQGDLSTYLTHLRERVYNDQRTADFHIFYTALSSAIREVISFRSVSRSYCWIVLYESISCHLQLLFHRDNAEWRLFAKPDENLPNNARERALSKHPMARMVVDREASNLLKGTWEICLPVIYHMKVQIDGSHYEQVETWEGRMGLPNHIKNRRYTALNIQVTSGGTPELSSSLKGTYKLLPNCEAPCDSLHKKMNEGDESNVYFFLDPDLIGDPIKDSFVFSKDHRRLIFGENRDTIAHVKPSWRSNIKPVETQDCTAFGEWRSCQWQLRPYKDPQAILYKTRKVGTPITIPPGASSESTASSSSSIDCNIQHVVIASIFLGPNSISKKLRYATKISPAQQAELFRELVWLTKDLQLPFSEDYECMAIPHRSWSSCQQCSPCEPQIVWMVGTEATIVGVEDVVQAGALERSIKILHPTIVVQTTMSPPGFEKFWCLQIGVNFSVLGHQAMSQIPFGPKDKVHLHCRLEYFPQEAPIAEMPDFTFPDNRDCQEFVLKLPGECQLRPEQKRSVRWMFDQEAKPKPFKLQAIQEAVHAPAQMRCVARFQKEQKIRAGILADEVGFGKTATMLALIHATYHKALQHGKVTNKITSKATVIIVPKTLANQWTRQVKKFLGDRYNVLVIMDTNSLKAKTLEDLQEADIIIVAWVVLESRTYTEKLSAMAAIPAPANRNGRAQDVWLTEACRNARNNVEQMGRNSSPVKAHHSLLDEFEKRLTDPSMPLYDPLKRLVGKAYAKAAKAKEDAEKAQKSKGPDTVKQTQALKGQGAGQKLQAPKGKQAPKSKASLQKGPAADEEKEMTAVEAFDSLRAKKISDIIENNTKSLNFFCLEEAESVAEIRSPLFHFITFFRVVIDEYTYVGDGENKLINLIPAERRWVLSGTPRTGDTNEVKQLARFLGINLGPDDDTPGVIKYYNIQKIRRQQSKAEVFRSLTKDQSLTWHMERRMNAQTFLDQFARKNIAEIDEIRMEEQLRVVHATPPERAVIMELMQQLYASDMKIPRTGRTNIMNDRTSRLKQFLLSCPDPPEALLKRSAYLGTTLKPSKLPPYASTEYAWPRISSAASEISKLFQDVYTERQTQHKIFVGALVDKLRLGGWLHGQYLKFSRDKSRHSEFSRWVQQFIFRDIEIERIVYLTVLHILRLLDYNFGDIMRYYQRPATEKEKADALKAQKQRADEARKARKAKMDRLKKAATGLKKTRKGETEQKELRKEKEWGSIDMRQGIRKQLSDGTIAKRDGMLGGDSARDSRRKMKLRTLANDQRETFPEHHEHVYKDQMEKLIQGIDDLVEDFGSRLRSFRFFESASKAQQWYKENALQTVKRRILPSAPECAAEGCNARGTNPDKFYIMGLCGHFLCEVHWSNALDDHCPAKYCGVAVVNTNSYSATELGADHGTELSQYGSKVEAIIKLIKDEIPAEDQVLLFIQWDDIMEYVSRAFTASGISNHALTANNQKIVDHLDDFQHNSKSDRAKVMMLNSSNMTAAGANLTNANHVIFLTPLWSHTKFLYHQSLTQCIGRSKRFGQQKKVYVYKFILLKSIDVDVVEWREGGKLVREEGRRGWKLKPAAELTDREKEQNWACGFLDEKGWLDREE